MIQNHPEQCYNLNDTGSELILTVSARSCVLEFLLPIFFFIPLRISFDCLKKIIAKLIFQILEI